MRMGPSSKMLRLYRKSEQVVLGLVGLSIIAVAWQAASGLGWINPIFISSPSQVVATAVRQTLEGNLWADFRITVAEFAVSFGASVLIGVIFGMMMGWYRRVEYAADPFIWFLYSSPLIAFYPLFVIWFGLGFNTVVMIGFILAVIPIAVNTFSGVKEVNPLLVRAARSFGASTWQILTKIAFPSAIPMIVTGLRIGVERTLVGVIVGEMFTSNQGLGFRISYYGSRLHTADLFVSIILVVLFGLLLTQWLRVLETRLMKWKR